MKRFFYFFIVILTLIPFYCFSAETSTSEEPNLYLFDRDTGFDNRNGPLKTQVLSVWQQVVLSPQAFASSTLEKGELNIGFQWAIGNFFHEEMISADREYTLRSDVETHIYMIDINYGVLSWLTVGMELKLIHNWGGMMDPYIQSFHRTFRSPNGGRELYPDNQMSLYLLHNDSGTYIINMKKAYFGLGDIVLKTRFKIFQTKNKRFGIGAMLALKLPTGSSENMTGSGSCDFGGGIALEFAIFRWWIAYINVYYVFIGNYKGLNNREIDLVNKWQITGTSEWIVSSRSSFIFQYTMFNSPWKNVRLFRVSGIGIQAFLGFKYRITPHFTFQFFIMEDFEPWTTSDITFSFGFYFKM